MATRRTIWHPAFTRLLTQRGPAWSHVRAEVPLVDEPLVVDDIIEVLATVHHDLADTGQTLRGLWPHIVVVGLVEFKSISREFRRGDLFRLLTYGWLYLTHEQARTRDATGELSQRLAVREIMLALVVPSINGPLMEELTEAGMTLPPSDTGYHLVHGSVLRLLVIDITAAAEVEGDDIMRWFGRQGLRTLDTKRWVQENVEGNEGTMSDAEDLEGFNDWVRKLTASLPIEDLLKGRSPEDRVAGLAPEDRLAGLAPEDRLAGLAPEDRLAGLAPEERLAGLAPEDRLAGLAPEERLAGLAPEERLAGLAPEERLAGLAPEETVLALPVELLRRLPESFLETLSEDVRARVRARVGS